MRRNELRVFFTREEMMADFKAFCENEADVIKDKELTAQSGCWNVKWAFHEHTRDTTSMIAGLCFNRIRCDVRVPTPTMMFCMSRIRCRHNPIEPMQLFYKVINP